MFAYGQTGSGKTFTISGLEKLVVEEMMAFDRTKESRKVFITIVELVGNAGYGKSIISIPPDSHVYRYHLYSRRHFKQTVTAD